MVHSLLLSSFLSLLLYTATASVDVDYSKILKHFEDNGLVSQRLKRHINNERTNLAGVGVAGCPFSSASRHSVKRRSVYQAAEHVLSVLADLTSQLGFGEAQRRAKRSINFSSLNCLHDWSPCDSGELYRSIDGRCNNLVYRTWGSAPLPYIRFSTPAYDDNVNSPRQYSTTGNCLPPPREISTRLHMKHKSYSDMKMSTDTTHMLMLWGQFLDHDLTMTPERQSLASCCTYSGSWRGGPPPKCVPRNLAPGADNSNRYLNGTCMAIEIKSGDNTFGVNHECIDFQRSVAVPSDRCELGHREQVNIATAFIDGSQVYGSDYNLAWELRKQSDGAMKMDDHHHLPKKDRLTDSVYSECVKDSNQEECFKAGDDRVNVQPGLASIHTLLVMEHNRIAALLDGQLSSSPSNSRYRASSLEKDEFLYQETRRIIAAMLQHITYNEFLPTLLSPQHMAQYQLTLNRDSDVKMKYNHSAQPTIRNEFPSFAFRVGHTMIPEGVLPMTSNYSPHGTMSHFINLFQSPHLLYQYGADKLLWGIISKPTKDPSTDVVSDLENVFSQSNRTKGGLDLVAFNIQRARDHGIPSYTTLRKTCDLSVPTSFAQLDMPETMKAALQDVYESVDDIDPWTGAVSENRSPGSKVGPLNACIIGRQFRQLKEGDRFFYEFRDQSVSFTDRQLAEIYKTSLAGIMCKSLEMTSIQPDVFHLPSWKSSTNERMPCSKLEQPDFSDWFV